MKNTTVEDLDMFFYTSEQTPGTNFSLIYQCDIWEGTKGSLMDPSVNAASSWLMRTILPVLFLLLAASKFMGHLLDINKPTSCLGLQELPDSMAI